MHRSRSTSLLTVATALILALAACSGGGGDATQTAAEGDGGDSGETVSLAGGQFSPSTLTIPVGTTVTFTDGAGHTVTNGTDGTPVDAPIVDEEWSGDPIVVSFDEAGTFDFTCRIHPGMSLTVTVDG